MIREKCRREGHKYRDYGLPYVFCARWFCAGSDVAPWVVQVAPLFAERLRAAIPEGER